MSTTEYTVSILLQSPHCLAVGSVPSPFDCYLVNRGLKTLHLRMRQHEKNAMVVAKYLESSPCVEEVFYPGRCDMCIYSGYV